MTELRPVVFSGPSGAGKSSLISMLMSKYPKNFGFSVSHTSRLPRAGEIHTKDYFFTTKDQMLNDISNGNFLEYAEFAGNMYGTPRDAVLSVLESGRICILDVDANGVRSIHSVLPPLKAKFVFVEAPSLEILERRLRSRGTETEAKIRARIEQATVDSDFAHSQEGKGIYHLYIINDRLEEAFNQLQAYLEADIQLSRQLIST